MSILSHGLGLAARLRIPADRKGQFEVHPAGLVGCSLFFVAHSLNSNVAAYKCFSKKVFELILIAFGDLDSSAIRDGVRI